MSTDTTTRKFTKVYEVILPDENDGRGSYSGGLFANKEAASRRASDANVMGHPQPGGVVERTIYHSYDAFLLDQREQRRLRALAKLSPEDRAALGL